MREPGVTDKSRRSERVEKIARDLTVLVGVAVLMIVTLVAYGSAAFSGRKKLEYYGIAAMVAGSIAASILKTGYARPKPDLVVAAKLTCLSAGGIYRATTRISSPRNPASLSFA